jgi:hypothetical protein
MSSRHLVISSKFDFRQTFGSIPLLGEGGACRRQAVPIARRSNTSLNSKGRTTSDQALAPIAAFIFVMRMSERLQIAPQPFVCSRLFRVKRYQRGPTPKPTPTPPGPTPMPTLGPLS